MPPKARSTSRRQSCGRPRLDQCFTCSSWFFHSRLLCCRPSTQRQKCSREKRRASWLPPKKPAAAKDMRHGLLCQVLSLAPVAIYTFAPKMPCSLNICAITERQTPNGSVRPPASGIDPFGCKLCAIRSRMDLASQARCLDSASGRMRRCLSGTEFACDSRRILDEGGGRSVSSYRRVQTASAPPPTTDTVLPCAALPGCVLPKRWIRENGSACGRERLSGRFGQPGVVIVRICGEPDRPGSHQRQSLSHGFQRK